MLKRFLYCIKYYWYKLLIVLKLKKKVFVNDLDVCSMYLNPVFPFVVTPEKKLNPGEQWQKSMCEDKGLTMSSPGHYYCNGALVPKELFPDFMESLVRSELRTQANKNVENILKGNQNENN